MKVIRVYFTDYGKRYYVRKKCTLFFPTATTYIESRRGELTIEYPAVPVAELKIFTIHGCQGQRFDGITSRHD